MTGKLSESEVFRKEATDSFVEILKNHLGSKEWRAPVSWKGLFGVGLELVIGP